MDGATLACWLATAAAGLAMLLVWVSHGGLSGGSRLPQAVVLGHGLLAVAGLGVWIAYVKTRQVVLAWTAFGLLLPVVLIGLAMYLRWLTDRRVRGMPVGGALPVRQDIPAERWFPRSLVFGHGLLATATLVLVLLVAVGVGR